MTWMARSRPQNLKASLIRRVVLVALLSLLFAMAVVLFLSHRAIEESDRQTALLVSKELRMQLLRISVSADVKERFPDWPPIAVPPAFSGRCIAFIDPEGAMQRNSCIGTAISHQPVPNWFAGLYKALFPRHEAALAPVVYRDQGYGSVSVLSDSAGAIASAWRSLEQMFGLTLLTILGLSLLIYVAIERALAPTKEVVAGLGRIAAGDFSYRLPRFRLSELQEIGSTSNSLAQTIEAAMAERARLSRRLLNAQEQERRRLARELHDEFAQNVTAIRALAASIEASADPESSLQEEAQRLSEIAQSMLSQLDRSLLELRPAELERLGLLESLQQLISLWNVASSRTRFLLVAPDALPELDEEMSVHLYRIAQEALTNAAKHADAGRVTLSLHSTEAGVIRLMVEDNGHGRKEAREGQRSGRGLVNMQERVSALGGEITITDAKPQGLSIACRLPIETTAQP